MSHPGNSDWRQRRQSGRGGLHWLSGLVFATGILWGVPAAAQLSYESDPINYDTADPQDVIAALQQRIDRDEVHLGYEATHGYLQSLLSALDVPVSSQMLVFSKTSFQLQRISPRTPRALYYNDDVYIGWVQHGDVLEISAVGPQLGANFYTLSQSESERPRFERQTHRCLICHGSSHTQGVPGHMIRSVIPSASGMPIYRAGTYRSDHRSPLEQRWGGWYVTGTHGKQLHMGNVIGEDRGDPIKLDMQAGSNLTTLDEQFDTSRYLAPHSDIVSLMVVEHQTQMQNVLTRANFETQFAMRDADIMNRALGRPEGYISSSTESRIASSGNRVLTYLLFQDEAALESRIRGTSGFREDFQARGPRDSQGRSLRDLELESRLFRYRCSFLIYSQQFAALPRPVREYVLQRLWTILTAETPDKEFAYLPAAERKAIWEILGETLPDLPDYWSQFGGQSAPES